MNAGSGGCHPRLMSGAPSGCVPTVTRTDVLAGHSPAMPSLAANTQPDFYIFLSSAM
jgi:hypothetical protein